MAETVNITLRYSGKAVDDGSMPVDYVVEALQGFSGAYGKIANNFDPSTTHSLRVAAVRTGSFELGILASAYIASGGDLLKQAKDVGESVRFVFGLLSNLIATKKHLKGKPPQNIQVKGDNNTLIVVNADGATIEIPPQVLDALKEKTIDNNLQKIVDPLAEGYVETAELVAQEGTPEEVKAKIEITEKQYFVPQETEAQTRELEITGKLVSLNKERNRGTFKLQNNETVSYQFVGENKEQFHSDFSHDGPVRAIAVAHLDENLSPVRLDIKSVQPIQELLSLPPAIDTSGDSE